MVSTFSFIEKVLIGKDWSKQFDNASLLDSIMKNLARPKTLELKRQLIRTKTWLLDFVKDKFPIMYDRIEAKKGNELKILHVIIQSQS